MDQNAFPRVQIPPYKGNNNMSPLIQPIHTNAPTSSSMPSFANDASDTKYNFPPIQIIKSPLTAAINPFFPPLTRSASSHHKRTRSVDSNETEETEPTPGSQSNQQTNVFAEIHAAVCLEVLKTRYWFVL